MFGAARLNRVALRHASRRLPQSHVQVRNGHIPPMRTDVKEGTKVIPGHEVWWEKYANTPYMKTRHLSPYEQNHMNSLLHDLPHKIKHRLEKPVYDFLIPFLMLIGTMKWAENAFYERGKESWH
jgi:hypothetical protein